MLHPVLRPSRRHFVMAFAILACGLGRFGGAAWAGEVRDEPETVAPVEFGAAKPVKPLDSLAVVAPGSLATVVPNSSKVVSPNSLTFVAPAKSELVGAVGFNLNNVARDVALEQIKADTLTPEAAWQSGALTFDNLADLLEHPADPWIINERRTDGGLHHRLIALLLQHEGARLEDLPKVPQRLRLWLADYYQFNSDPKCLKVAQSILDQKISPLPDTNDASSDMQIVYQAIERMAWFYRDQDQGEKGAQMWLSMLQWLKQPGWWQTFPQVEAARYYRGAGQIEKAKELYEHLTISPSENVGLFVRERGLFLMGLGQYQEAQKAVDQSKASLGDALPTYIPLYLEATLAMKQGLWDQAHRLYLQSAGEYTAIGSNNKEFNVVMLNGIQQGTEWSQKWMQQEYDFSVPDMTSVIERSDDGTASTSWTVRVDCARSTQFKVECANPKVKITTNDETEPFYGYQTTFDISVTLGKSDDFVDSEVRIYPVGHPEQGETVPLFIEVK